MEYYRSTIPQWWQILIFVFCSAGSRQSPAADFAIDYWAWSVGCCQSYMYLCMWYRTILRT